MKQCTVKAAATAASATQHRQIKAAEYDAEHKQQAAQLPE
jgi:hypothetical protein